MNLGRRGCVRGFSRSFLSVDGRPQSAAIRAIDEVLSARGDLHLITGQPLHPLPKQVVIPPTKKPKETMEIVAASYRQKQLKHQQGMAPAATVARTPNNGSGPPKPYAEVPLGNQQPSRASSSSVPTAVRVGNDTVVQSRASGSGSVAGAKDLGLSQTKVVQEAATERVGSPCVVCASTEYHYLKECPIVKEGPKR